MTIRRPMRAAFVVVAALAPLSAACVRGGRLPDAGVERDLDRITADELAFSHWSSADDIVRALRPRWLAVRGPDSIYGAAGGVQVRMDDMWLGGVASLRGVPRLDLDSLVFVDPVSAAGRWGGNFRDGVILIYGRHGPRPDTSAAGDTAGVRIL